jgi:hypothetical protein
MLSNEPMIRAFIRKGQEKKLLMSWQNINQILGLAMVDANFAHRLLTNPLETIQEFGFELTEEEVNILREVKAADVSELSQILVAKLPPEDHKN